MTGKQGPQSLHDPVIGSDELLPGEEVAPVVDPTRDYLEMLIHKLDVMKYHGANYYARKQDTDKRYFDLAKKDVNNYLLLLKKRGYNGDRFKQMTAKEQSLF